MGGATMLAAIGERYGTPDVVEVREIERPEPTGDAVLVRVHVASVNRADLDVIDPRPGFLRLMLGLRRPRNARLGIDVAGVVEAVGPDVRGFAPGDRVFADLFGWGRGAFAEYVAAPEAAFQPIPEGLSFEHAATLPHGGILAFQGLRLRDGRTVGPGDRVLIEGATGSVGPFALQIAKARGAEVTGVCSTSKIDLVRSLGADHVIDHTTTDYTRTGERYDWILAADSHHSLLASRRALRPGGVYVTLGGDAGSIVSALVLGPLLSRLGDRRVGLMLWWKPFDPADVRALVALIAEGRVTPVIDRRYPLAAVRDALERVHRGDARGKVLVTVRE
ncbi:MAG: NAD(P)-dependent alcohol dehydrogenase [Candidatus Limnocylindria bacterium]